MPEISIQLLAPGHESVLARVADDVFDDPIDAETPVSERRGGPFAQRVFVDTGT